MESAKNEIRDNMQINWDAPIRIGDGIVLRADVYRPVGKGKFPVILSYGPYAKGLSFQEGYKSQWARLTKAAPMVLSASTRAAPGVRRARSMCGRRARRRIFTLASNGRARRPGATARSASTAFPITQGTSGTWV